MDLPHIPSALIRYASAWLCWLDRNTLSWTCKTIRQTFLEKGVSSLVGNAGFRAELASRLNKAGIDGERFCKLTKKLSCVLTDLFVLDIMMGVPNNQIRCFRMGKEHPACHELSDRCYLQNGCSSELYEFGVSTGASLIKSIRIRDFARLQCWNVGNTELRIINENPEIVDFDGPQYVPTLTQYRDFPMAVNVFDGERLFISDIDSIWAKRCTIDIGNAARRINSRMKTSDERVRKTLRGLAKGLEDRGFAVSFFDSEEIFDDLYPANDA